MTAADLELRPVPQSGSTAPVDGRLDAFLGGDLIARLQVAQQGTPTQVAVAAAQEFMSPLEAEALIAGLLEHDPTGGATELSLITMDPCTR
ncbi:MAG TPA: hypothetical protein VIC35_10065, partial [Acidimicrobiia bacterium]